MTPITENVHMQGQYNIMKNTKIIVFSDSHGIVSNMRTVLDMHSGDTGTVIHLGDGKREFLRLMQSYPEISHFCVNGNYEDPLGFSNESSAVVDLGGIRIFAAHGHTLGVKSGMYGLIDAARERGCDIALYGHTHVQDSRYISPDEYTGKPLWIVNPGSIGIPRDGFDPKYAIINIVGGKPLISCTRLEI